MTTRLTVTGNRILGFIMAATVCMAASSGFAAMPVAAENYTAEGEGSGQTVSDISAYQDWVRLQAGVPYGTETIRLEGDALPVTENGKLLLKEGVSAEISVQVSKAGLYGVRIGYSAVPGTQTFLSPLKLSLAVNGIIPYREAADLSLSRVYQDMEDSFAQNHSGDDIQPEQQEVTLERTYLLSDSAGYHPDGLSICLEAGHNRIGLTGIRGETRILWVELGPYQEPRTYAQYREDYAGAVSENTQETPVVLEAEHVFQKSDCTISPLTDRSSAGITPNSPSSMLLNTIGGANYSTVGQWMSWKADIPSNGFYTIVLRGKQSMNVGAISSRKLLIDGNVPFAEAAELTFPYNASYQSFVLGNDGKTFEFYLEKGIHEIGLEVVLGPMAEYLQVISKILSSLNQDYLRILFYTGINPDVNREYGFAKLIPDVMEDLRLQSSALKNVSDGIKALSKSRGANTATLDRLAALATKMGGDTDEIARNFGNLNDALSALGSWLNTYSAQPFQMDSLAIVPSGQNVDIQSAGLLSNLWFKFRIFLASFLNDYAVATAGEKTVNVWIATGRDQSKIISRLSENSVGKTGVRAKLSLVSADALLPNVLAGSSVDVYINAAAAEPINFAIRGAVLDLTQFPDFDDVAQRFHSASLLPFTYKNAVYALPESFDFPLMFYRKDIFGELGITVPRTWDDFYETVALLQKNNLTVGVNWSELYTLLLYQNGGRYFNDELTKSALAENKSIEVFEKVTRLYSDYGLPVEFSFPNRFRNGSMPLGIVSYTMYNQLYLFAPEISGQWEFTQIPGILDAEGQIRNMTVAGGSGAVILRTVDDRDAAWEFLKWWTSTETQTKFGIEMEKVMGPAARQSSANLAVVAGFPWSAAEYEVIRSQWDDLSTVPQIPGSYFMSRVLDFAFNSVYSLGVDPVKALQNNARELNEEIARKTKEFAG